MTQDELKRSTTNDPVDLDTKPVCEDVRAQVPIVEVLFRIDEKLRDSCANVAAHLTTSPRMWHRSKDVFGAQGPADVQEER